MKNVELKVDGNTLIIKVDLNQEHGYSQSGKSVVIATTGGNWPIFRKNQEYIGERLNVNVTRSLRENESCGP
jgi:hypothetical protein